MVGRGRGCPTASLDPRPLFTNSKSCPTATLLRLMGNELCSSKRAQAPQYEVEALQWLGVTRTGRGEAMAVNLHLSCSAQMPLGNLFLNWKHPKCSHCLIRWDRGSPCLNLVPFGYSSSLHNLHSCYGDYKIATWSCLNSVSFYLPWGLFMFRSQIAASLLFYWHLLLLYINCKWSQQEL